MDHFDPGLAYCPARDLLNLIEFGRIEGLEDLDIIEPEDSYIVVLVGMNFIKILIMAFVTGLNIRTIFGSRFRPTRPHAAAHIWQVFRRVWTLAIICTNTRTGTRPFGGGLTMWNQLRISRPFVGRRLLS